MQTKYLTVNTSNVHLYHTRYIQTELYDLDGILNFMTMHVMMFESDDEWWFKR